MFPLPQLIPLHSTCNGPACATLSIADRVHNLRMATDPIYFGEDIELAITPPQTQPSQEGLRGTSQSAPPHMTHGISTVVDPAPILSFHIPPLLPLLPPGVPVARTQFSAPFAPMDVDQMLPSPAIPSTYEEASRRVATDPRLAGRAVSETVLRFAGRRLSFDDHGLLSVLNPPPSSTTLLDAPRDIVPASPLPSPRFPSPTTPLLVCHNPWATSPLPRDHAGPVCCAFTTTPRRSDAVA